MRITILTSLILAALTTTVAARARVPRSLLVGLKRQGETSPVIADAEGECPTPETQTSCGGPGKPHSSKRKRLIGADPWSKAMDAAMTPPHAHPHMRVRVLPTLVKSPHPNRHQRLKALSPNRITVVLATRVRSIARQEVRCFVFLVVDSLKLFAFLGCCATTCLAADAEGSTYVCEIVEAPPPEETTSTEDIVTSTPAPRPPPTGNNNPTPTRTPNRSTTSSRGTGSAPTNAPGDGAGSVAGKSAVVVAGLVGAMMALA